MFSRFSLFAHKYKYYILAGWVILAALFFFFAPSLEEVGVTDQSQFLPEKTESAHVRDLLTAKFPAYSETSSSTAIIVVYNENGLGQADEARAKDLRDWLISAQKPAAVESVVSVYDNAALRTSLVSADNTTMMLYVGFNTTALDDSAKQAVKEIRQQFTPQDGTRFYLTGSVGFLQDLFESVNKTIARTTQVTIILVIILLLIVYRSPIAAFVPLLAIGASYLVSRGIIGFIADAGVSVSTVTDVFMVVTMFGVGTDYCLFIMSRFRENLGEQDRSKRIVSTMQRIGPIIFASAVTVIIAFLCLSISRLGMTRSSGWALAIGITITLIAGLTLVPALMSIFGRYLFWPSMKPPAPTKQRKYGWAQIGGWISRHPLWISIPIIVLLVLPYIAMPDFTLSANILTQLPKDAEATKGLNTIREHFAMGELSPLTLLIESKDGTLLDDASLRGIEGMAGALSGNQDLARVDTFSAPAARLNASGGQVRALGDTITPAQFDAGGFSSLTSISDSLQALALQYQGITRSPAFTAAMTDLATVTPLLNQVGAAAPAEVPALLSQLQGVVYDLADSLTTLGGEFELQGSGPFVDWLKAAYFSADGTVAKIGLVLNIDPYSDAASEMVPSIRESVAAAVAASTLENVNYYVGGDTAVYADMLQTSETDFTLVIVVTTIGILLVIIILLRSILAPLYMVATVLFNYGAALGITSWILQDIFHYANLINMLPVIVFVLLAAVGADYNIFLVSRIREEAETKPIKEAVHEAVAHTGGVITSCGVILTGTFATLMISSFPMVLEIGTAIAIGVLLDTFVVRALLVPSLVALLGRWSWWPSPLFKKLKKD
ncbi:MAG: MMPL family transporter [Dehalococcoidales bacterium]|jgi:RND superfamily putative drug exporter